MTNKEFSKLLDRFDKKIEAEFIKHTNVILGKLDQILEEIKLYQQDLVAWRA